MVVQHNMTAINANRYFGMNNNKLSKSLETLSSGYAINRAGDKVSTRALRTHRTVSQWFRPLKALSQKQIPFSRE